MRIIFGKKHFMLADRMILFTPIIIKKYNIQKKS